MRVGVISYNIHCVPVAGGCSAGHIDRVGKYLRHLLDQKPRVGVVVLNEIFLERARKALLRHMRSSGRSWQMTPVANTPSMGVLASSGVVVAWRPDLVVRTGRMHEITFRRCCQFDCLAYKGAIHVPLRTLEGDRFHVVGTHMQALELPGLCAGVRDSQTEHLGKMVRSLERSGSVGSGEPVLLAGDFNESSSEAMETRLGASHMSCEGDCRTHAHGEFDHFFLRAGDSFMSRCSSYRALRSTGVSNPSDHDPIYMSVDFSK